MFCLEDKLNWLYIDINSYFATIEQQVNIRLRNKPIIVVPMLTDSTCAIAASYDAKKYGITTGTKVYNAKKLCPELICVPARHKLYIEYHHKIFQEIDKYLHVDHIFSIDEGACKLTGNLSAKGKAQEIAKFIQEQIKANVGDYITCSIGIAPNRYLAKVASNMQKPNGLTIISPEDLPNVLYSLTLTDLPGIGNKTLSRLTRCNILSMLDLIKYTPKHLKAVCGNIWGEKLWYLLRGLDLPIEQVKNDTISNSQVLAPELRNIQSAKVVLANLVLKVANRLRARSLYTNSINLILYTTKNHSIKHRSKIELSCDTQILLSTIYKYWDLLINLHNLKEIKQIRIELHNLQQKSNQLLLCDFLNQQRKTNLSKTIDFLNNKFGKNIINIGVLADNTRNNPIIAFNHISNE